VRLARVAGHLLLLLLIGCALLYGVGSYERKRAWDVYETVMCSFANSLPPGKTRTEVESYLTGRGVKFERICCDSARGAYDLVKVGDSAAPWYCSKMYVYVGFYFRNSPPTLTSSSDALRDVELLQRPDGCIEL